MFVTYISAVFYGSTTEAGTKDTELISDHF